MTKTILNEEAVSKFRELVHEKLIEAKTSKRVSDQLLDIMQAYHKTVAQEKNKILDELEGQQTKKRPKGRS